MKKFLSLFILMLLPIVASADPVQINGIYYNLVSADKKAEVTNSLGGSYQGERSYSGSVTIPATVTYNRVEYSVTSIGSYAFYYCTGLTSVTIPNSVTSIGNEAFGNCSSLTSVTIPNSVTSIGDYAFSLCSGLTSVTIPNSVTSIGDWAFFGCSGLTSVTIPNSVTSIGYFAFQYCSGLTSVTIPNSVTSIGDCAFWDCSGLKSVTIPNSVTSIGVYAFYGCSGLTSVTIPNSVTSIGDYAFYGCSGLTSPIYTATLFAYMPTSYSGSYNIPDGIKEICGGAFSGCTGLTSVTIPNSVTSIGNSAFYNCSGLTSVTIGSSVTSIGAPAFSGCKALMTVKSYITEPFNITGLFSEETYRNGTLYVPADTKDLYIRFDGWREFLKIEEMGEEPAPNGQCATPTILFVNKKFRFECETPGAEFESFLTTEEKFTGNELAMESREIRYTLTVYATAPGYDRSEPAKVDFIIDRSDVNQDGTIDVADIAAIIDRMAGK